MLNNSASLNGRRRHRQLLSLLLVLLALGSVCCADGFSAVPRHQLREGKHKLCGQALNEAMDMVCVHGYNTIPKKRMDHSSSSSEALEMDSDTEQTQLQPHNGAGGGLGGLGDGFALSPLLSSIYGTEVLIKTRRLRRQGGGIYDECCRNSCTTLELFAYCRQ